MNIQDVTRYGAVHANSGHQFGVSNQLQPPAAFNSWFKKTVFGIHRVGG
jgi:hypothetical protein